tara:strand:- start:1301 stop:1444 length:144 start_codon:yes stop_codon:yes gene_type:complete
MFKIKTLKIKSWLGWLSGMAISTSAKPMIFFGQLEGFPLTETPLFKV